MYFFLFLLPIVSIFLYLKFRKYKIELTDELKEIVLNYVPFIHALDEKEKQRFYNEIIRFINKHDFEGVETEVTLQDKTLVASCATMLFFNLEKQYLDRLGTIYVSEMALQYDGLPKKASGFLRQRSSGFDLFISRKSLFYGFSNLKDNKNVGIHELAHLLDGIDGSVDGFPHFFIEDNKLKDWQIVLSRYKEIIKKGEIDKYALTNKAEFFAVLTEYFFENPFSMQKKHEYLYQFLSSIYKIDLVKKYLDNRAYKYENRNTRF